MLRPSGQGGARPGGASAPDHLYRLLQEARDARREVISAHLSDAGFSDIPSTGALVLAAAALNGGMGDDRARVLAVTRMLGISESDASQLIDALALHGYLEFRTEPGEGGGRRPAVTKRGHVLLNATLNAVKVARWADFPFRQGDIVVSTWPKSGTTWVQTICALLIFQTPDLPAPLSELSPFLDLAKSSRDDVYAQLAAQKHRRVMKTHLPLSDIIIDPRATYIAVGRHPLDSVISMYHHSDNTSRRPDGAADSPPQDGQRSQRFNSPREWLLYLIDKEPSPQADYHYLAEMLRHLSAAWARRHEPNVVLVHYEDLSADLEGEMRRVASRLEITVPEVTWPSLVEAATFEHMRADPDRFIPAGTDSKDSAGFFRSGSSGEGRMLLTSAELARYRARTAALAPPDLLAWLHRDDRPA